MAQIDLTKKFPQMISIKSPPPLARINGIGTGVYGRRDHDPETNTYVTTLCISVLFVPILCLRAYRVAPAQRGWYFLGREPLSGLARGWNVVLLAAALLIFGGVRYDTYTSSPAYKAKRQMAEAHKLADGGHLAGAAKIYQTLALAGEEQAANATDAIKGLMDAQCRQAPLTESAGVFSDVAQVARRRGAIPVTEVVDKGMKLVTERGDSDPRGGIAMLDAVRPLVIDTRPIDAVRLSLLRKWAAADPANLDVIVPLASLLSQQGQFDEAKKLLLPRKDALTEGEGARVQGTVLARTGDFDGAYALLWPYVKSRLDALHAAEQNSQGIAERLWQRELKLLNDEKGPRDFYEKYKAANADEQRGLVREYVNGRLKNDPEFTSAQEALERETEVVPVALELGMVMLQRAQGQTNPATRKDQLVSAEQVFLAIGGIAGQTAEYRISLGQVYYWLGKQADGRKLFDDFLAAGGRNYGDVLKIAIRLRQLGALPEARAMGEEAYSKTSKPEEQNEAATFRSLCSKDLDDQIAWLRKASSSEPWVKATLAKALGDKAYEEGREAEAGRQFRTAIDAYAAMPRTASTVNDTALAYFSVFLATGDRSALDRSDDYFQQAVALQPSDPVLLYNAGVTLLGGALADIIGADIDLRALHDSGSFSLLAYLYNDQASHDVYVRRVKEHPGMARALSYLEKVTVLSPKSGQAFAAIDALHEFTRDDAALHTLETRIKAADIDTADQLASVKDHLSGVKDQQSIAGLTTALKRADDQSKILRAKGGRTAAVAIANQSALILALDAFTGTGDLDKAVELAEEARKLCPSTATTSTLIGTYILHASKDLRHADPDFDAFCAKYGRSVGMGELVPIVAGAPGPFQKKVLENPQFKKALDLIKEENRSYPDSPTSFEWAMLISADPAEAEKVAQGLSKNPRRLVEQSIDTLLHPASADVALQGYWLMQALGKPDDGRQILRKVADMGIPLPPVPQN
jgi:tetratricopeptide (TPR) repeat protein